MSGSEKKKKYSSRPNSVAKKVMNFNQWKCNNISEIRLTENAVPQVQSVDVSSRLKE
jgi:hypothetical protein